MSPLPHYAPTCDTSIDYFLIVARNRKIVRTEYLVEAGEQCLNLKGQQITIGPNLFIWRDSGYGAALPANAPDFEYRFELSTLRVNGCASRRTDYAIVRHSYG